MKKVPQSVHLNTRMLQAHHLDTDVHVSVRKLVVNAALYEKSKN